MSGMLQNAVDSYGELMVDKLQTKVDNEDDKDHVYLSSNILHSWKLYTCACLKNQS